MSSDTSVHEATATGPARPVAPSTREGLVGSAVVLLAMVAAVLALAAPVAPLTVVLWLLTLLVLPGLALLPGRAGLTLVRWVGAVVALSLVVETFGYVAMLWSTLWHPRVLAFAVLVASANVLAVRVLAPWWSTAAWGSALQRRLSGAAIALTLGGAVALALTTSRRAAPVEPPAVEPPALETPALETPALDPAPSPPDSTWFVVTDAGDEVLLDGPTTVGRTRTADVDQVGEHELTLVDATRTMSRRHLVLSVEPDGVLLVDQGSLNGATVQRPSHAVETCRSGGRLLLGDGDVIEIAERRLTLVRRAAG